jgi:hypothetical protein
VPGADRFPWLARLTSRWWALIPVAAIVGTVFGVAAESGTADVLTWLALVTTPPLAAVAFGYAAAGARPAFALAVIPLFVLAWRSPHTLAGEGAALILVGGACVTLATMLAAAVPEIWLKAGLIVFAATDTYLVADQLLQQPNGVLNAAAPGGGLPQFQRVSFGSANMGYGDLFAAALLGALLAGQRRRQLEGAALVTVLAWLFGLLFFTVDTLPATVPVAAALVLLELRDRRAARRVGSRTRLRQP